jgi:hypothetical protein
MGFLQSSYQPSALSYELSHCGDKTILIRTVQPARVAGALFEWIFTAPIPDREAANQSGVKFQPGKESARDLCPAPF